jgi:hypothetical protein
MPSDGITNPSACGHGNRRVLVHRLALHHFVPKLLWWQALLGLVVWPYFLGLAVR